MNEEELKLVIANNIQKGWVSYGDFRPDVSVEAILDALTKQLRIGGVMRSDCDLEKLVDENREYILGFYTGDELKKYLSNNYA